MTEGASPAEPAAANLLISDLWSLTSAPHAPSFTTPGQGQGPGIGRREVTRPGLQTRGRGHRAPALQPHLSSVLCPLISGPLPRPGGHSAEVPPDPIPNSAVKLRRAQGTAPKGVGERVAARSSQGSRDQRSEIRDQRSETRDQRPEIRDRKIEADDRDQSTALGSIERRRPTAAARGRFAPAQPSVAPAVLRPPSRPASRSIGLRSPRVCPPISVLCPLILAYYGRGVVVCDPPSRRTARSEPGRRIAARRCHPRRSGSA
jgi:hypothetical protein